MFYEQNYNTFPTWLNFITKLNFNQLNILKNKIDENDFGKKISKKENTKETGKKSCEEKLYQSIVFFKEKLVITILNQLNI
jgi:hypothetical protein